jgi:DNA-directed RNA polymerase specialized sigma24 family protein
VNPSHLFLGTNADNSADMAAKGRAAKGDANGARLHPATRARGTRSGMAKLTDDTVREIRAAYAAGESQQRIADRLGIDQTNVSCIVRRLTWRHVA